MAQSKDAENMDPVDLSAPVSYEGSCHCKAVRFSARLSSPLSQSTVVSCNCSYCHVSGSLIVFVDSLEIHHGSNVLKEYRFGTHSIQIFFCGSCGANVYNKSLHPKFKYGEHAVNIRLFHGIDLEDIKITKTNGKAFQLPPLEETPL
ncbi:Mss4-like protein [Aspergillus floccosus]